MDEDDDTQPTVISPEGARNLLDDRSEREQRKRVDNEKDLASKFWRDVFSTTVGRREMWGVLRACAPGGTDPFAIPFEFSPSGAPFDAATWARAGQYQIAQKLFQSWLMLDRDGTILMLDENSPHFKKPPEKRRRGPREG